MDVLKLRRKKSSLVRNHATLCRHRKAYNMVSPKSQGEKKILQHHLAHLENQIRDLQEQINNVDEQIAAYMNNLE